MLAKREVTVKCSEVKVLKDIFPEASLSDMIKLKKAGTLEDIQECAAAFPENDLSGVASVVRSRNFIRWYTKNKRAVNMLALAAPAVILPLFGLTPGSLALKLFTDGSTVAYAAQPAAIVAFGSPVGSITTLHGIPNAVAAVAAPAAAPTAVQTSFFGGKGAILLHMLVAGFFTLVVSSFLKFTGRGDLIPLVAFVGGGIILYEVIGLFNDIYGAIKTMLSM